VPKKDSLWHDYDDYYITPRMLLDALDDACEEMSFSNYHCNKFRRTQKLLRRYVKKHSLKIGPTKKAMYKQATKANDLRIRKLANAFQKIR
jgi:hypothetical protein